MNNLEIQLQKYNLTESEWEKLCWYNYNHLLELRGKVKKGQKCIFEYSGMPVMGEITFVKSGKFKECQVKFNGPFMDEQNTCYVGEHQIKVIL